LSWFLDAFVQAIGTTVVLMLVLHIGAGVLVAVAHACDEWRIDIAMLRGYAALRRTWRRFMRLRREYE